MKGFLARYHQVLAIAASAGVLVITGGTLTGIILAGRHGSGPGVAGPTPSPTFDTSAPTLSPSQSPSGSASASPGGASPQPGGPLATPIGFGNGGAGCLGLTNCTPRARATQAPVVGPPVTATYASAAIHGAAVSAATDGSTIFFTEGLSGFGSVSASSPTPHEFTNLYVSRPMGIVFNSGHLWVIDGNPGAPQVVEFAAAGFDEHAKPIHDPYTLPKPGHFQSQVQYPIAVEGITVDPFGDVWFSEFQDDFGVPTIGHIFGTTVENCPLKVSKTQFGGSPMSIVVGKGSDHNLYIGTTNGLGRWAQTSGASCAGGPAPGTYTENRPAGCATNGGNGYIESLAVGPDSNVWFGTPLGVGEYTRGAAQMVVCNTNGGLSGDHFAIVTAPDPSQAPNTNALWATFSGASAGGNAGVARIFSTVGTPINAPGASASSDLRAIVADSAGNLWIADNSGKILEARPAKA